MTLRSGYAGAITLLAILLASQTALACDDGAELKARVSEVYPTADSLPENLLRFYIYFSKPMRRNGILSSVDLVDQEGVIVEGAFIENRFDLWSPDGRRLTLLFDPGRVKTGLVAHDSLGRALVAGQNYTLIVRETAQDAEGCPLGQTYRKAFGATEADFIAPDFDAWQVITPKVNSRDALAIVLNGPHDHASLAYRIRVRDPDGQLVRGSIELRDNEQTWLFTPLRPWQSEAYGIVVNTTLEDIAGNRLTGLFDRPVETAGLSTPAPETRTIVFRPVS